MHVGHIIIWDNRGSSIYTCTKESRTKRERRRKKETRRHDDGRSLKRRTVSVAAEIRNRLFGNNNSVHSAEREEEARYKGREKEREMERSGGNRDWSTTFASAQYLRVHFSRYRMEDKRPKQMVRRRGQPTIPKQTDSFEHARTKQLLLFVQSI